MAAAAMRVPLLGGWTLMCSSNLSVWPARPVRVPGQVALQIFPEERDPYVDFEEETRAPAAYESFMYSAPIPKLPAGHVGQIYFEAIDTVARISTASLQTASVDYFLPAIHVIRPGDSSVNVSIESSLKFAASVPVGKIPLPHTINYNVWDEPSARNRVRKPASDFGWDWGPAFPHVGIPGNVFLEHGLPGTALIDSVLVHQHHHSPRLVNLTLDVNLRHLPGDIVPVAATAELYFRDGVVARTGRFTIGNRLRICCLSVHDPKLWYPVGLGPQPLYVLKVLLNDRVAHSSRIGLRTVRLVQWTGLGKPAFHFLVNNQRIMLLGANYVPADAFAVRESEARISSIVRSAVAANHNILRVWGGGRLPPPYFYEECDAQGVMVWQDLPFACAMYSVELSSTSSELIRMEATRILSDLQYHPSIIAWGGNNEVEAAFAWFPVVKVHLPHFREEYVKLFIDTLRPVVERLDPHRPYLDSSPSNGAISPLLPGIKAWGNVNDPNRGDVHFYNYHMQCEDIGEYPAALLVSEHGVQSLPRILERYVSHPELLKPVLKARLRHEHGFEQMQANAQHLFPYVPPLEDLEYSARALLSQLVQGRCLESALWAWRSNGKTSGALLWSMNDVWPGVSWSLLEYDASWKVSLYRVKQAMAVVSTRAELHGDDFLVSCHATQANVGVTLRVELIVWGGPAQSPVEVIHPRSCEGGAVARISRRGAQGCRVVATWGENGTSSSLLTLGGEEGASMAPWQVEISSVHGNFVSLHARSAQVFVWLDGASDKGWFEPDNGFAMTTNETRTLRFMPFAEGAHLEASVLRVLTLGDLLTKRAITKASSTFS